MMIDIQHAVIKQLSSQYPDLQIYDEKVEQGLERPCFFVEVLPISIEKINPEMQKQLVTIDIQYMSFEETKEKNLEMATDLPQLFKYVNLLDGKKIRVTNEQFETVDGILHYLFDLDFIVKLSVTDDTPLIGEINIKEVD